MISGWRHWSNLKSEISNLQSATWEMTQGAMCALCESLYIPSLKGRDMTTSKEHLETLFSLAIVWVLLICPAVWAVTFAGGSGEPNDPYQIATAKQLIAIGSDPNLQSNHYILINDIDLAGVIWTEPVIAQFSGSFDGNDLAIRNLTARGARSQGLFGYILSGAQVKNLAIVDADIIGTGDVAAMAINNAGTVMNCYSTGTVISIGSNAGGLVSNNLGIVVGSYSEAEVLGGPAVGGLIGYNGGIVSDCYSTGPILGDMSTGGLAGRNHGSISSSYSTSPVTGVSDAGGLAGYNDNAISSCYSTGNVSGGGSVGGLVGYNWGSISSCYSVSSTSGSGTYVGGLVGDITFSSSVVTDCYFLVSTDGGGPDNEIGAPLTSNQMKQQASFIGFDFWATTVDGTRDLWFMPEDAYPALGWQTQITGLQAVPDVTGFAPDEAQTMLTQAGFVVGDTTSDFCRAIPAGHVIHADPHVLAPAGATIGLVVSSGQTYDWASNPGDGTALNPYQIQTAGQLESLGDHPELWEKSFALTADMDMAGRTYSAALIAPNVNDTTISFQGTPFTGTFDGQTHTVKTLTISASGDYLGLFGLVDRQAQISSLNLTDAIVIGHDDFVGVLAGYNDGILVDCSAQGVIMAGCGSPSNGLVGSNRGDLIDCSADVAVVTRPCSVRR
jgi:hypothetical protein